MFKIILVLLSLISSTYSITCPTGSQESFADWGNDLRFYYMMRDPHCVVAPRSVTTFYPVSYHANRAVLAYWYSGKCCYRDKLEAGHVCTSTDILDNYYQTSKTMINTQTVFVEDTNSIRSSLQNDAYKENSARSSGWGETYQGSLLVTPPISMTVPANGHCLSDKCLGARCCQASVHPTKCSACSESGACEVCVSAGLDATSGCNDQCPVGHYCIGVSDCKTTSCRDDKGVLETVKSPCPAGKFNNDQGGQSSAACKRCEKGFYAYEASPTCTSCPAGKKNNAKGGVSHTKPSCHCTSSVKSICTAYCLSTCPLDKDCGEPYCSECNKGKYSEAGARDCKVCGKGRFSVSKGTAACTVCAAGFYSTIDMLTEPCTEECAAGTFGAVWDGNESNLPVSSAASCKDCPRYRLEKNVFSFLIKIVFSNFFFFVLPFFLSSSSSSLNLIVDFVKSIKANQCVMKMKEM